MNTGAFYLTISIGTCENYEIIDACLRSIIKNQVNVPYEVYVVDNCSTDGSIEKIEKKFPQVKIIKNLELSVCHGV